MGKEVNEKDFPEALKVQDIPETGVTGTYLGKKEIDGGYDTPMVIHEIEGLEGGLRGSRRLNPKLARVPTGTNITVKFKGKAKGTIKNGPKAGDKYTFFDTAVIVNDDTELLPAENAG